MNKFLIYSPSYDEYIGGCVALHKLCHILNELGYTSYLHPFEFYLRPPELKKSYRDRWREYASRFLPGRHKHKIDPEPETDREYKTNPDFNTPILADTHSSDNWSGWVVVYPEITEGNPLGARHVVRWFLHQPGFHLGTVQYGENELYFKFGSGIKDFSWRNSRLSKNELRVFHYPPQYYKGQEPRSGTAYCVKKGAGKPIVHDLENSILIDGKSHAETADIFRKVESFISYDTMTAYSVFAILCGAQSIVVPDKNVSVHEWMPNKEERYGIAYGFSEKAIKQANSEHHYVISRAEREAEDSVKSVQNFVEESNLYFKS